MRDPYEDDSQSVVDALVGDWGHDHRLAVARRWAQWYLGDPSWADDLLEAYLDPEAATEALDRADPDPVLSEHTEEVMTDE